MKTGVKFLTLILSVFYCSSLFAQEGDIVGVWDTEKKDAVIRIFKAKNGLYYGKVEYGAGWAKGEGLYDENNPDPAKRTRLMKGVMILKGFKYNPDKEKYKGRIYAPDNGKTYRGKITMDGKNKLRLRGYIGVSLLGRTTVWSRKK